MSASISTSTRAVAAPPAPPALPVRWARVWWIVLGLAVAEVLGHFATQSGVATSSEWADALAFVRAEWQPGDAVVAAPHWADPLLREAAGDLIDRPMAGRSDTAAYARLWVVSVRAHRAPEAPPSTPDVHRLFGHVLVERFALPAPTVRFDFVEHLGEATVVRRSGASELPCRRIATMGSTSAGLQAGPLEGAPRFQCDPARAWLWVAPTTTMDLDLRARRCIGNQPQGPEPIITRFADVELHDAVVVYGGLWWEQERWRNGGDVDVVVRIDGEEIGRMAHHDGDGWKRMEAAIPEARRGTRGTVSFEISADNPDQRTFCWSASMREEAAR